MLRSTVAAVLGMCIVLLVRQARAGETTMSEPVIEENVTDVDGREAPTIEFDLTPGLLRAQHSNAGLWKNGLEAEWRPFDRFGVGAELDATGSLDGWKPVGPVDIDARGALSYVFLRDFERRIFLQAEVAGRYGGTAALALIDPTESVLPYSFGLRTATNLGPIDFRFNALGEAGGSSAHAPVKGSAAALYTMIGEHVRGALGAELVADWARSSPFLAAPEGQFLVRVFGKPVRFEVAVPITVGAKGNDASYGVAFRFVIEPNE